jgi:protein required for attachment to host cells
MGEGAMLKIPKVSLVVVADGVRARLFRSSGKAMEPTLQEEADLIPDLKFEGASGIRPPESDPQEFREATFAKQVAHALYQRAHAKNYEHLVLIADSGTLGEIRDCLHKEVRERVLLEIHKELTKASVHGIEAALAAILSKQP